MTNNIFNKLLNSINEYKQVCDESSKPILLQEPPYIPQSPQLEVHLGLAACGLDIENVLW